jgi:hypothetical protein
MIISSDNQSASQILIIKDGAPVGCVQRIDTKRKVLWRFRSEDVRAWISGGAPPADLVEESYDTLVVREA